VAQPDGLLALSNDPPFERLIVFRDGTCLAYPPEADFQAGISEGQKPIPAAALAGLRARGDRFPKNYLAARINQ
jgi:hypothetical protein